MGSDLKPTVVVVHGSWHCPEQYSLLTDRLSEAGYKVAAPSLPSSAFEETVESFDPDVEVIRELIEEAADQGEDVIVVCHSYGGMPAGEATKGFLKQERAAQGLKGGVLSMVYMCAFVPDVGQCLLDVSESQIEQTLMDNGKSMVENPAPVFYQDVEPTLVAATVAKLRPQSRAPVMSRASFAPWKHIQSTYIICEKDLAIRAETQEKFTHPSRGGKWTIRRIDAGHSPFLNMPDRVFDIIEETIKIARASS